ncbi:unnamed protein product [Paramecium octaurelia]|uniref:Uncharacterized protein n=1 Tax=Paramecium octaurelia TaxID=43137 RepID=A0A8S1T6H9_PAROT|nr:unnamed protein product [Paramecium octaurelia]
MRQQKDGLFSQSQLYVKELCESLNVLEFLDDQANLSITQSSQPENLQMSNKSNKNENLTKINREIKQNPYGSEWANKVLETQFGVHLSQITLRKRPKWIIKKLKPVENDDNNEKQHSRLINDIKTQERLYRKTTSKSNNREVDNKVKNYRQSFSRLRQPLPTFGINFVQKLDQCNNDYIL